MEEVVPDPQWQSLSQIASKGEEVGDTQPQSLQTNRSKGAQSFVGQTRSAGDGEMALEALLREQHAELLRRLESQEKLLSNIVLGYGGTPRLSQSPRLSQEEGQESQRRVSADSNAEAKNVETRPYRILSDAKSASMEFREGPNLFQRIVATPFFDGVFAFFIIASTSLIGAEVQYEATHSDAVPPLFKILDHTFAAVFMVEIGLRYGAAGRRRFFHSTESWWNMFDCLLVATSILEFFMSVVLSDNPIVGLTGLRMVKIIRITRVLRILRIARIVRIVSPLNILLHSIVATLKAMIWAMLLLVVNLYFFSIVFTQISTLHLRSLDSAADIAALHPEDAQLRELLSSHWSTLPRSMMTLFQAVTGGLDWAVVADPLGKLHWLNMGLFLVFFTVTFFAMFNVITGFFCQAAIRAADHDRDLTLRTLQENRQKYAKHLRTQFEATFSKMDSQRTGSLTLDDFQDHICSDAVSGFFLLLDIDISDAWTLFKLLDSDESGVIDAEEFVDGCLRLKGPAKSIDLATFRNDTRHVQDRMLRCLEAAHLRHTRLSQDVNTLTEVTNKQTCELSDAKIVLQRAMERMDIADRQYEALLKEVATLVKRKPSPRSVGSQIPRPLPTSPPAPAPPYDPLASYAETTGSPRRPTLPSAPAPPFDPFGQNVGHTSV